MKTFRTYFLVALLVFCLSGCSGSPNPAPDTASPPATESQEDKWSAQADEIKPLLSDELSSIYPNGAEVRVSNSSGEIKVRVNTFNTDLTFQDFANVISVMYDKYSALVEEYSDYDFGPISFYFIAEDASAILQYSVDSSGVGEFTEDRSVLDEPFTLTLTPDEVFERLQDTLDYIS